MAITVGAVSKAVDRLVTAGWCVRVAHPDDRRSSILRLTPQGERILAASRPVVEDELASLTAGVSREEMARIAKTLATLRAFLEAGGYGQLG